MVSEKIGKPIRLRETGLDELIDFPAEVCFRKSVDIFAKTEMEGERARTLREWAKYELGRGNKEQGIQLWNEARTIFEKLGADLEVGRMAELPS